MKADAKIMKVKKKFSECFRPVDLFIILVFLLIAIFCVDMFRYDFLRTINLRNVEPVGTVVIKKNTVQRRLSDRVLWDRLSGESPVYIGDLIRVAEISAATLSVDESVLDLDENTLIRITRAADGKTLQIVLGEGNLSLATGSESGNISFELNGIQVHAKPNSVVSAGSNKTGDIVVQITKGSAQIIKADGTTRKIASGSSFDADAYGTEKQASTAVAADPLPDARYQDKQPETPPAPPPQPRQTPSPPTPPLASPRNLQPARGSSFGLQDFRTQRSITFNWTAVQGANAYIFTLYQQTAAGKKQIVRQTINNGTSYTLTNLSLLDRGNFSWQVEAISTERGGAIERRGAAGESAFIIDFPASAPLQIENTETANDG